MLHHCHDQKNCGGRYLRIGKFGYLRVWPMKKCWGPWVPFHLSTLIWKV